MDYRRRCVILEQEIADLRETVIFLALTLTETNAENQQLKESHGGDQRIQAVFTDDEITQG